MIDEAAGTDSDTWESCTEGNLAGGSVADGNGIGDESGQDEPADPK